MQRTGAAERRAGHGALGCGRECFVTRSSPGWVRAQLSCRLSPLPVLPAWPASQAEVALPSGSQVGGGGAAPGVQT